MKHLLVALGLLLMAGNTRAGVVNWGIISFDVLVPADGPQAGVNQVNLQNLTGAFSLAPDFPVLTDITLTGVTLTVVTPGGSQVLNLSDFGPGSYPADPVLEFASDAVLLSLTLAGTIGPTTLTLEDSSVVPVANTDFLFVLLPSAGSELIAGFDLGVLTVETTSDIPEPATVGLVLAGVIVAAVWRKR